jgi:hypothetical protein
VTAAVDLKAGLATVEVSAGTEDKKLMAAIEDIGFEAKPKI